MSVPHPCHVPGHDYELHHERDLLWCRRCGRTKRLDTPPKANEIVLKVTSPDLTDEEIARAIRRVSRKNGWPS